VEVPLLTFTELTHSCVVTELAVEDEDVLALEVETVVVDDVELVVVAPS
jgi:hypothetical protein